MLIADGGGGYGGTHWMAKEVPAMWAAIANQDTETHYQVVGGWSKTAELTLAHLAQVRTYRDNLASVWPPSKSPAAAAYIARLDKLMADLQATHDAASANYTAFSTVTLTLSIARRKLEALYAKYESNAKQNFVWQQKQAAAASSPTPSPTPSPSPGPSPTPLTPPVSAAQQEELNRQARVIMYDLSSTVLSGHAALQKPKPYKPGREGEGEDGDGSQSGGGAGGFAVPPVIPAPGGGSGGPSGGSLNPGSTSQISPISPTTHTPIGSGPNTGGGGGGGGGVGSGPILGGIGSPPVVAPPNPGLPSPGPAPTPAPPGLGPVPGLIGTPSASGLLPSGGGLLPNGTKTPQSGLIKPGMPAGSGRMTMPSGGVIGANPGSGMIGQMPNGTGGGRPTGAGRVNPVGGVIGQPGGTPSTGRGGTTAHGLPSQGTPMQGAQGRARNRREQGESDRWDPDNPWATEEGVSPVVLPPDEQGPIDPGPAIGYSR